MRELGIAWIRRNHRLQPMAVSCLGNLWQERLQPAGESSVWQTSPHQISLAQTGRKKIFARRFVFQRTVLVAKIELPRFRFNQVRELSIARSARIVGHQS